MLAKEVERSVRCDSPLAILMMDVDGFKLFNETYGHHAGDNVLRQVAQVLMRTCRTADIVGRYGGDEFMVILPETDREGAAFMANRILEELSRERLDRQAVETISRWSSAQVSPSVPMTASTEKGCSSVLRAHCSRQDNPPLASY